MENLSSKPWLAKMREDPETCLAMLALAKRALDLPSWASLGRLLLGTDGRYAERVRRWRALEAVPSEPVLRRLLRVCLWAHARHRVNQYRLVDWDNRRVVRLDGRDEPDPFVQLKATPQRPFDMRFEYGTQEDQASSLQGLMDALKVDRRAWLTRLLGMNRYPGQINMIRRWMHHQHNVSHRYLARAVILALWQLGKPPLVHVNQLWAVDWENRNVEWRKGAEVAINPFVKFFKYAVQPPSRPGAFKAGRTTAAIGALARSPAVRVFPVHRPMDTAPVLTRGLVESPENTLKAKRV